ncbi:hypothetical protein TNCV_1312771 [Trichonephila clavipes]|nr:hypothetical protein TNCV_1312771 [Trichonephila clavipes]
MEILTLEKDLRGHPRKVLGTPGASMNHSSRVAALKNPEFENYIYNLSYHLLNAKMHMKPPLCIEFGPDESNRNVIRHENQDSSRRETEHPDICIRGDTVIASQWTPLDILSNVH